MVAVDELHGLIPARAGNTSPRSQQQPSRRAHPRSRGEHLPRMAESFVRIADGAHPRSRGEHSGEFHDSGSVQGSSPLARGTQLNTRECHAVVGLIPARAGNTDERRIGDDETGAHPRSRGEHGKTVTQVFSHPGSSPLARGTLGVRFVEPVVLGLIPAREGNTRLSTAQLGADRAHPRSRGEHLPAGQEALAREGSSPLARGTLSSSISPFFLGGLIPARAGNTSPRGPAPRRRWAHPRSRGEHLSRALMNSSRTGSSPLARGTLRNRK